MPAELSDQGTLTKRFPAGVPCDSPCFDGHFPDNPITPGAVLLGYAAAMADEAGFALTGIRRMKFLRPLGPGEPFSISISRAPKSSKIVWDADGEPIATAQVVLEQIDD